MLSTCLRRVRGTVTTALTTNDSASYAFEKPLSHM
jgi:hypothetical protein